ncbi:MAG: LPS export ABC transporter periplasmic protein LptC [Verrucomicrobiota bacterium]|nr:MAG: LPS export ABC transporter periplasmic protein LptC [Verrucomicrobiota bacterium]
MLRHFFHLLGGVFLLGSAHGDSLHQFAIPFFNSQGVKVYNISGKQADVFPGGRFCVQDVLITTTSEEAPDLSIMSDQAKIDLPNNEASGDGFIVVAHKQFSATGEQWELNGAQKQLTLNKNVQVFFEANPSR